MKREYKLMALAALHVSIFASFFGGVCDAQLQTSSTQQSKFYGRWNPPESESTSPTIDSTREKFSQLFPPTTPTATAQRPAFQLTGQAPAASDFAAAGSSAPLRPAPLLNTPAARPLQPSSQNRFLQGTFLQPEGSGQRVARANHFEAPSSETGIALPNPNRLAAWPSEAPKLDHATLNDSGPSITGVVDSMQSGGKELWSKFQTEGGWGERIAAFVGGSETGRFKNVFGSLAVVVGGYLAFVALMRKFNFTGSRKIPSEVIEVIGNAPFGPRKDLQLVRLGSKLLLLMNSPEGTHPVGEITDPEEVDYLISLCNGRGSKASSSVRSVAKKFGERRSSAPENPRRMVQPTASSDATFSTKQLVQALESIRGNHPRSNAIFEA